LPNVFRSNLAATSIGFANLGAKMPELRLEWRSPAELAENPANWRRHPESQLSALTDIIAEVGWAGACLFNERTGRLIDGHARRKVALEQGADKIPVLVGDWDEATEKKILATLDPLAAMADTDAAALEQVLREIQTGSEHVAAMLDELAKDAGIVPGMDEPAAAEPEPLPERYQILIEFASEAAQAKALEKLTAEGYACRSLIC
jgi:ParB-like chromosome segregation protein Spo0J